MHNFINTFNNVERFRKGRFGALDRQEDPTFLTFSIDFNFDDAPGGADFFFGHPANPLFLKENKYSALSYLRGLGLGPNAARLEEFTRLLMDITHNKPWYFQSVSGLNKLWENDTNMSEPFKGKEVVLEFETLEAIDMKIGYMADLYRKSAFDSIYRREIIPPNLRKFEMSIWVAEFRKFQSLLETYAFNAIGNNIGSNTKNMASRALDLVRSQGEYFNKNVSFVKYNCHLCEFDFSETFIGGDKLNVHTPDMASNKFKIKVGWFMEQNNYTFYDIMNKEYWSKYYENEDQWSKKRILTLNGAVNAVSTAIGAAKNITGNINDIANDIKGAFNN
jgi:hypothetical protein